MAPSSKTAPSAGQPTAIRLTDDLLQALDAWAAAQPGGMSRSQAAETLLTECLNDRGYLGKGEIAGLRPDQLTSENDG